MTHSTYGRNGKEITQSTNSRLYTGGAFERTAGFNSIDSNGYFSTYWWTTATGLTVYSSTTKYATKYNNKSSTSSGTVVYTVGKTGDAIKEVFGGSSDWFGDNSRFADSYFSTFLRSGYYDHENAWAGVFHSDCSNGGEVASYFSFRTALCPQRFETGFSLW